MGRFLRIEGVQKVIDQMDQMGQSTGDLANKMLFAAGADIKRAWQIEAAKRTLKISQDMIDSIDYSRTPKMIGDIQTIEIYPQGKDRKGVRNAEKAFILHYGTSPMRTASDRRRKRKYKKKYPGPGIPALHWVDDAEQTAAPMVEQTLAEMFDAWLNKIHNT